MNGNHDENAEVQLRPETIEAMLEAERIARDPNIKSYSDIDELFNDLDS